MFWCVRLAREGASVFLQRGSEWCSLMRGASAQRWNLAMKYPTKKKARPRFRIFGVRAMQIILHTRDFNAMVWIRVPHKTHDHPLFQTAFAPLKTTWDAGSKWKSSRAISRISTCYSLPVILAFWAKCFKIFLMSHLETINMEVFISAFKRVNFSWLPVCTQTDWLKQEDILVCICSFSVLFML